jgi:hypothetical protein
MGAHAPGFTAIVEGGLPAITIKLDGSQDLWTALNDVCKRAGAKMVLYGTTLRVFTDDAGWDPPDDVTEGNPTSNGPTRRRRSRSNGITSAS